jgi:ribosomal-protein-serine acetyltransferase
VAAHAGPSIVTDRIPDHIEAPRLTIRRWSADDADAVCAAIAASIDHLRPWMPWAADEPIGTAARRALFENWNVEWEAGGDLYTGMFLGDEVIGGSGLHRRRGPHGLEIGYWVHIDHTRSGYASEVAAALTTTAFAVEAIDRVEIHHDKANVASAGVPRRLGFSTLPETLKDVTAPAEIGIDCGWVMSRSTWLRRAER